MCVSVLLKALPQVCMKYTVRDKNQVAKKYEAKPNAINICHKTLIKSYVYTYFHTNKVAVL